MGPPPKKAAPAAETTTDDNASAPAPKPSVKSMGLNIPMMMPGMGPPPKKAAPAAEPVEESAATVEQRQSSLNKHRRPTIHVPRESRTAFDILPDDDAVAAYLANQSQPSMFFFFRFFCYFFFCYHFFIFSPTFSPFLDNPNPHPPHLNSFLNPTNITHRFVWPW
jgi:hypothetical protein